MGRQHAAPRETPALLEILRRVLVNLQVVNEAQWDQSGAHQLGLSLEQILNNLQRLPAWFDARLPALTEFQRHKIEARFGKQSRGLDRELRVNNYLILSELGRGGMARVDRAWSIELNQEVAIKRISVDDPELLDRQMRETRILPRLKHPHIVRFLRHEPVEDGYGSIIAMELVRGETLQKFLENGYTTTPAEAQTWIRQLLGALQQAHSLGIVHRDLTWKNVMMVPNSIQGGYDVKLLDFGLGKILNAKDSITHTHQMIGTWKFMPPEQFDDSGEVTEASDIYSLGCVAYAMLTGDTPFTGERLPALLMKHQHESPPPLSQFRSDLPPRFAAAIQRMLAKSPRARGTVAELIAELREPLESVQKAEMEISAPTKSILKSPKVHSTTMTPPPKTLKAAVETSIVVGKHPPDTASNPIISVAPLPSILNSDPIPTVRCRIHAHVSVWAYVIPPSPLVTRTRFIDVEPGIADVYGFIVRMMQTLFLILLAGGVAGTLFLWSTAQ